MVWQSSESSFEFVKEAYVWSSVDFKNFGKTPLMRAVSSNNLIGVVLLLNSGADPTKRGTFDNRTPIEIAYESGYTEILKVLIEFEAKMY